MVEIDVQKTYGPLAPQKDMKIPGLMYKRAASYPAWYWEIPWFQHCIAGKPFIL